MLPCPPTRADWLAVLNPLVNNSLLEPAEEGTPAARAYTVFRPGAPTWAAVRKEGSLNYRLASNAGVFISRRRKISAMVGIIGRTRHAQTYVGLSQRERRLIADVESHLTTFRPGQPPASVAPIIRELLGVNLALICSPDIEQHRVVLQRIDVTNESISRLMPEYQEGLRTGEFSLAVTLRAPEPKQRNQPIMIQIVQAVDYPKFGLSCASWDAIRERVRRLVMFFDRHGIAKHYQTRTLICDSSLVLRFFNVLHERALSARQLRLYRMLLDLLRNRAVIEHRLTSAASYQTALEVVLDGLDCAAFITDRNARIVHANRIGSIEVARNSGLPQQLADALAGRDDAFIVRPIASSGAPLEYLIMARRATLVEIARTVAAELGLGARRAQVLELLAAAEPTKIIAARLGIAEGTVEYHVTALFRRLGVSSRPELQRLLADRI